MFPGLIVNQGIVRTIEYFAKRTGSGIMHFSSAGRRTSNQDESNSFGTRFHFINMNNTLYNASAAFTKPGGFNSSILHHFAMVKYGQSLNLYVDGVKLPYDATHWSTSQSALSGDGYTLKNSNVTSNTIMTVGSLQLFYFY